jgi:hypothetical protein
MSPFSLRFLLRHSESRDIEYIKPFLKPTLFRLGFRFSIIPISSYLQSIPSNRCCRHTNNSTIPRPSLVGACPSHGANSAVLLVTLVESTFEIDVREPAISTNLLTGPLIREVSSTTIGNLLNIGCMSVSPKDNRRRENQTFFNAMCGHVFYSPTNLLGKSKLNKKANWSAQSQLTSEFSIMRYGSTISSGSQVGYETPTVASGTLDLDTSHALLCSPRWSFSERELIASRPWPHDTDVASEELREMHRRDYLIKWELYTSRLD